MKIMSIIKHCVAVTCPLDNKILILNMLSVISLLDDDYRNKRRKKQIKTEAQSIQFYLGFCCSRSAENSI